MTEEEQHAKEQQEKRNPTCIRVGNYFLAVLADSPVSQYEHVGFSIDQLTAWMRTEDPSCTTVICGQAVSYRLKVAYDEFVDLLLGTAKGISDYNKKQICAWCKDPNTPLQLDLS